ncbi:hypothetical protein K438DRAFT_1773666 [Mycena galopus ATCC 62051]|nr:hypothetical protein K438DRAFT_1773666 [Mycena galopus ATCC 62051]
MKLLLSLLYIASLGLLGVRLAHDTAFLSKIQLAFWALRDHLVATVTMLSPRSHLSFRSHAQEADIPPDFPTPLQSYQTLGLTEELQEASTPSFSSDMSPGLGSPCLVSTRQVHIDNNPLSVHICAILLAAIYAIDCAPVTSYLLEQESRDSITSNSSVGSILCTATIKGLHWTRSVILCCVSTEDATADDR